MNLLTLKEKYMVACDMNCGNKAEVSIQDDAGNLYMHMCLNCADKIEKSIKNYKKTIKKA